MEPMLGVTDAEYDTQTTYLAEKIDPRLKWRLRFVAAKNGGFYISMLIQLTLEKCFPSNENLHVSPECYQNIQV